MADQNVLNILEKYSTGTVTISTTEQSTINRVLRELVVSMYNDQFLEDVDRMEMFAKKFTELIVNTISKLVSKQYFDQFVDNIIDNMSTTIIGLYPSINKKVAIKISEYTKSIIQHEISNNAQFILDVKQTQSKQTEQSGQSGQNIVADIVLQQKFLENSLKFTRDLIKRSDKSITQYNNKAVRSILDGILSYRAITQALIQKSSKSVNINKKSFIRSHIRGVKYNVIKKISQFRSNSLLRSLNRIHKQLRKIGRSVPSKNKKNGLFSKIIKFAPKFLTGMFGFIVSTVKIIFGAIKIAVKIITTAFKIITGFIKFVFNFVKNSLKLVFGLLNGIVKGVTKLAVGFLCKIRKFIFSPVGMYIVGYIAGSVYKVFQKYFNQDNLRKKYDKLYTAVSKLLDSKTFLEYVPSLRWYFGYGIFDSDLIKVQFKVKNFAEFLAIDNLKAVITKVGMGAAVSSLCATVGGVVGGMILPGIGNIVGAGLGAWIGTMIGDEIAKSVKTKKISLGNDEVGAVKAMVNSWSSKENGFCRIKRTDFHDSMTLNKIRTNSESGQVSEDPSGILHKALEFYDNNAKDGSLTDENNQAFEELSRQLDMSEYVVSRALLGDMSRTREFTEFDENGNSRVLLQKDESEEVRDVDRAWLLLIRAKLMNANNAKRAYEFGDVSSVSQIMSTLAGIQKGDIKASSNNYNSYDRFKQNWILNILKYMGDGDRAVSSIRDFVNILTNPQHDFYRSTFYTNSTKYEQELIKDYLETLKKQHIAVPQERTDVLSEDMKGRIVKFENYLRRKYKIDFAIPYEYRWWTGLMLEKYGITNFSDGSIYSKRMADKGFNSLYTVFLRDIVGVQNENTAAQTPSGDVVTKESLQRKAFETSRSVHEAFQKIVSSDVYKDLREEFDKKFAEMQKGQLAQLDALKGDPDIKELENILIGLQTKYMKLENNIIGFFSKQGIFATITPEFDNIVAFNTRLNTWTQGLYKNRNSSDDEVLNTFRSSVFPQMMSDKKEGFGTFIEFLNKKIDAREYENRKQQNEQQN